MVKKLIYADFRKNNSVSLFQRGMSLNEGRISKQK